MTTLLLANVGNHDVRLNDSSLLPESLQGQRLPARRLGDKLASNYDRYAGAVELPLIGVGLRWLLEREGVRPEELYVHLFASDQPAPPITPEGEWLKDSIPFAQVIRRFLMEGGLEWVAEVEENGRRCKKRRCLRLPGRQVHIHTISGNPADYKNMLDHFGQELPRLAKRIGEDDTVYLEVTGGTPAMTSMLIVAGVDVFGRRTHTLYIERGADRPYRVGIGRRLFARRARAALRAQLELYAYAVASDTLEAEKRLIAPDTERQALLAALLNYADRRLAFDFERARDALHEAYQYATGDDQARVQYWQRELKGRDSAALLAELVHSARIKYQLSDYADFTQRLFRFQEASFRHLAKEVGMRCKDKKGEYVDMAWVNGVPGLRDFLADYTAPDKKRYRPVQIDGRSLNRISLGAVARFFVENDPQWAALRATVKELYRLSSVADLRNEGLAGHGFEGIGKEDLDRAFGEDSAGILPLLEEAYEGMFGQPIGPNPYTAINQLILELLAL